MGNRIWGPLLESPDNFSGRVCIQDQSFNDFENDRMKLSVNEAPGLSRNGPLDGAEMRPGIVSGIVARDAPVRHWSIHRSHGPVPFSFLECGI